MNTEAKSILSLSISSNISQTSQTWSYVFGLDCVHLDLHSDLLRHIWVYLVLSGTAVNNHHFYLQTQSLTIYLKQH